MSTGTVCREERGTYAGQARMLAHAEELHADSVAVELDSGMIRVSLADAIALWDELVPGESFQVCAFHFGEHDGSDGPTRS